MKHMDSNTKDNTAKRGYQLTVSKIRRLAKYYKRNRKLPEDWRYTPEKAKLLVK
jgi:ribosomal protein S15P/S13E